MKTKLHLLTLAFLAIGFNTFAQPANDTFAGAIPITPSAMGTGCSSSSPSFVLPFSTDGTTDSGRQGSCTNSGLDQFFTWTATSDGLHFSSQNPGRPGIVIWDSTGTVEITCTATLVTETIGGWNIGDDLVIQIYDFQGTALVDVAFCLEEAIAPIPTPVTFTPVSSGASGSYKLAAVDMNNDYLDDIVTISSSNINIRQQNSGGGFTTRNIATTTANFLPTWSLAAGDYNRDGYNDLLYGNGSGVTIMRSNSTGTGFTEISGSENVFSQRSNFVDINNDGHLDAFVCHDVAPNVYYLNDGSGNLTFNQGGLGDYFSGGNYGSIWIDYDNDRDLDMFIAKCGGELARRTNQMLTNDGSGVYTENAAAIGLADPTQTWSAAWGDFDNDGDMDVYVGASSIDDDPDPNENSDHRIMINNNGIFTDVSAASGVKNLESTSTETVTYDFDNDGNLDLVSGGNVLFGRGDMTFSIHPNVFPGAGAYADLNNDGYIDAFTSSNIYFNNADTNNNWIKIYTKGTVSNINGIGARVELYTNAGKQIRDVRSGEGFRYMSSLNTHFGIGTETSISSIVVYWPSGIVDTVVNPAINSPIEIIEGDTLSLENSFTDDLVIYPNPAKDVLNINSKTSLQDAIYTVFDINGKRVLNAKLKSQSIDVSNLSTGNYILRIISGNTIKSQKFIKQ